MSARSITNQHQDFRLLSLSKRAEYLEQHGPYLIIQDGADPNDPEQRECTFVLTCRGTWLHYYAFLMLPKEVRERVAVLDTVEDVVRLAEGLPVEVTVETLETLNGLLHEARYLPVAEDPTSQALLEELAKRKTGT